jgi:hypothetical protein
MRNADELPRFTDGRTDEMYASPVAENGMDVTGGTRPPGGPAGLVVAHHVKAARASVAAITSDSHRGGRGHRCR